MAKKTWVPSKYVSDSLVRDVIHRQVPPWLARVSHDIMETAKQLQPRFNAKNRVFGYLTQGLLSIVGVTGPNVEWDAFYNTTVVPPGGFQFGDIDPKTGDPFPGGWNPKAKNTYITLEDKPSFAGETGPVCRTRVYGTNWQLKHGNILRSSGFLERAAYAHLGHGSGLMNSIAAANYEILSKSLAIDFSESICLDVFLEARFRGMQATIGPIWVV